jgi:outer membrane protein OmpA-like peptidoglycan-associated protein
VKLTPAMMDTLRALATRLKNDPNVRIVRIEGHTDNQGNAVLQLKQSQQRADAVRDFLIAEGVEPERLQSIAYGARKPIASNETESGRAENRRVDVAVE